METPHLVYEHPLGVILARFSERGLCELGLYSDLKKIPTEVVASGRVEELKGKLRKALDRFFDGKREDFSGIPIDLSGATEFRRQVWETARKVGWGEVSSYGGLAELMGRKKGTARAIGQALGANPIAIVVPCHRFLSGDGSLGGFSCGLHWKRALLRVEGFGESEK